MLEKAARKASHTSGAGCVGQLLFFVNALIFPLTFSLDIPMEHNNKL
jgi:hypothetical protein